MEYGENFHPLDFLCLSASLLLCVKIMKPELIQGGSHADSRGALRFCNDFDMSMVRRFYTIANSVAQPVRGWIGHRKETKWFFPMRGKTEIVVEAMGDFNAEEQSGREAERFVLKAEEPKVLKVPSGNWFSIKQDGNSEIMVFSNCKVGEFEDDDLRRPL